MAEEKIDEWFVETKGSFTTKSISRELDLDEGKKTSIRIKGKNGKVRKIVVWALPGYTEAKTIELSKKDSGYDCRIIRRRGGKDALAEEWKFDRKYAKEAAGTLKRLKEIQGKKRKEASDGIQQGSEKKN